MRGIAADVWGEWQPLGAAPVAIHMSSTVWGEQRPLGAAAAAAAIAAAFDFLSGWDVSVGVGLSQNTARPQLPALTSHPFHFCLHNPFLP
ncbi:hypothetical protein FKM82_020063 [Ascaphus truei]